MGRIANSWELVKQSFAILKSDKELALLPVASAISCLLVSTFIAFGGWLMMPGISGAARLGAHYQPNFVVLWLAIFCFYLANFTVIIFFNVALISAASERLAGRPATLFDGLAKAWERKGRVLQWALLAATVGVLLKMIEERVGLLGRIIVKLVGIGWTLASYFVVPVLAFEDLGPVDALKRSAQLFRETWGEEIVSRVSISLIFMLLGLVGIGVLVIPIVAIPSAATMILCVALMVLWVLALGVVSSAVQGIFTAALYQYATTKAVPPGFAPQNFSMAWGPKKQKF